MEPNWEALAQQDAQNSLKVQAVRGSVARGMDYNPDDYARALKLAARTGVAPDLAQEFHPEVQKAADLGQIDFFNLIAHNPATSKWLASQDNAAIAHDDLGTLTKIENDLKAPKYAGLTADQREAVVQDALRVAQHNQGTNEVGSALGSINHAFLSPLVEFGKKVAPYTPTGMLESQLTNAASGGFKQASNLWDWLTGKRTSGQAGQRASQINQDNTPLQALTRPGWATQQFQQGADALVTSAQTAQKVGPQAVLTDRNGKNFHNPMADTFSGDWGAMDWARREVVNPLLTRNTLNTIVGIPGTIGATMAGGEMTPFIFATNAAQAKMEQAKAEGANPTVAYLEGLGSGLLNFLLMTKMPAPVETKTATGAITQGLGRAVALGAPMTAGENLLARMHDPNRPLTQGMAEGIAAFAGFELPGAIGHAVNAYQTQKMLQDFKDAAEVSKLRQRSPEAFHDYVEQATKGTPAEHLMVPAEAFMTYFQSQGMDPARIAEELGAKNFQEAAAAGTDVVIPTANWVSQIVTTPHGEALAPDVRLRPSDLTAREIQNLQEQAPEILATMKVQGEMDAKAEEQPAFQSIKEDTFQQLVAAGDSPQVAETRAFNHAKVMTTLAERAGIDPMELHDRYGLRVIRPAGNESLVDVVLGGLKTEPLYQREPLKTFNTVEEIPSGTHYRSLDKETQARVSSAIEGEIQAWAKNPEAFFKAYDAHEETHGGRLVNGDIIYSMLPTVERNLLLGHTAGEGIDAGILSHLTTLRNHLVERAIDKAGDLPVAITAGGQSSGKTTAANHMLKKLTVGAVVDAPHDNAKSVEPIVRKVLASGNDAVIVFVDRPDFRASEISNIRRAIKEGRYVGPQWRGDTTAKVPGEMLKLGETFRNQPRVSLIHLTNAESAGFSEIGGPLHEGGKDAMSSIRKLNTPASEELAKQATEAYNTYLKGVADGNPEYPAVPEGLQARIEAAHDPRSIQRPGGQPGVDGADQAAERGTVQGVPAPELDQVKSRLQALGIDPNGDAQDIKRQLAQAMSAPSKADAAREAVDGLRTYFQRGGGRYANAEEARSAKMRKKGLSTQASIDKAMSEAHTVEQEAFAKFDEELKALQAGDIYGEGEKKGFIQFGNDKKVQIGFLEKADLSTFTHETGHMYMEILHDLAAKEDAPPQIKEDLATLRKFAGADPVGVEPLTMDQHETLARAFEAHLMEGKAPSEALKGTFQRVKFWMLHVYKSLANLGVKLTDDVRGAFDRLYASDQEIEQARKEAGDRPLFASPEDMKATPEEFALYSQSAQGEIEVAKTRLAQEKLRQELRERTAAWNEEAAGIRERITSEVDNDAVYQAFKALADGQLADGTPIKLNKDELVRQFGPEVVKELPRSFQRLYVREGGMDAEAAAEFLGFRSGEALAESLKAMEPRKARIERLTREEMLARHGDTLAPEAIAEAAQKEFHDAEPESKLIELRALRRQQRDAAEALRLGKAEGKAEMAPKLQDAKAEVDALKQGAKDQARAENFWARGVVAEVPPMETFKQAAKELVESQQAKDLTPYRYLMAQRKAAQDAFEALAKKDYGAAADAKQKELLNHFLYREATKGMEELEKGYGYMQKFGKASIRQKIGKAGAGYLEQIDGFLERFQFIRETNKAIAERQSLAEFAQLQVAGGEEIYFDPSLYLEQPKNYREMTLPEFRAVRDAIKNIETVARRQYEFDSEGKAIAFHDAVEELDVAARANANRIKPLPVDPLTKGAKDRVGDWFLNKDAMLLKMEQMVEWLDGGDINGPWARYIFDPIAKAQAKEYALQAEVTAKLGEAMESMPKEQRLSMLDTFDIPGIGKVTRKMILSMAMNMGNAENYEKILKGHGWASPEGLEAVGKALGKLNRADWEFVQATWDRVNELWPQIADLEQRMTGLEPPKVEGTPFAATLEDGSTMALRGGYYPLMYDPARSPQGAKQETGDLAGLTEKGYARATTNKGHTKERTKFSAPLVLDFEQVLASHTAKVIKDLTHREAALAINKLITNQTVRTAIQETLGPAYEAQFLPWLRGVVNDRNASVTQGLGDFNRTMMTLRANVAAATLGFKVSSVLVQATDLMRAADRVPRLELAGAFKDFIAHPVDTTMKVRELSDEMRFRADNIDRDMRAKLQDLQGKTGHYKEVMEFAFHGLGWADAITSTTAWLGAYRAELKKGTPEEQAVRQADRTVRLLMQAGNPKDLAAIQRQDGLAKIVTMFMGDASATYGLLRDTIHQTKEMGDTPKMAARIIFGALLPAIVGDLIKQRGPGIADDDPDKAKKWAQWITMKSLLAAPSSVPVLRDLANAIDNGMDYRFTPVASGLQKAGKLFTQGGKLIEGKGDPSKFAFNVADTLGTIGGVPGTAQLTTTGKYLYKVHTGEEQPKTPLEFSKNLVFGKNPQEKK